MSDPLGTWGIGFSIIDGETVPDRFIIPVLTNTGGIRLLGNKRSALIPPGFTGDYVWPFYLAGIIGADLDTEIRGFRYAAIGEKRSAVPVIDIPLHAPAKMANEADFIGSWSATDGGQITIADETPPAIPDGASVVAYRLHVDEDPLWELRIPVGDLPADLAIRPSEVPWWQWGVADFEINLRIACEIEDEIVGPYSDEVTVTITNTDTYYVDPADWSGATTDEEGPEGIVDITFDGGSDFSAPADREVRAWAGPMPAGVDQDTLLPLDWATDENTFPIAPGETLRFLTGVAAEDTAFSFLLIKNLVTGAYRPGTARKSHVIPALVIDPGTTPILLAQSVVITGLVNNQAIIGQPVTGDVEGGAAGWANISFRRNRFRINGVGVGTAVDDLPVTYTPQPADNRQNLSLWVRGVNTIPDPDAVVSEFSEAKLVVYAAPTLTGTAIADRTYTAGSGAKTISAADVAAAFGGTIEEYALSAGSGTINPATGEISVPNSDAAATLAFSVTASNSGGTQTAGFTVFWQAVGPTPFPSAIPGSAVTVAEIRDSTEAGGVAGKRKLTWNAAVTVPTGFELYLDAGVDTVTTWTTQFAKMTPGTPYTTVGALAVGATCRPRLGWRRLSDGAFQTAWEGAPFQILGLTVDPPTGDWPAFPDVQYNQATSQGMTTYSPGDGASTSAFFGLAQTVEAYESFRGRIAADTHTLAQIRAWVSPGNGNKCPIAEGGFNEQMDLHCLQTLVIAKNTPRIWTGSGGLTAAERTKCELLVQAVMIAGMWSCSTKTPHVINDQGQGDSLLGQQVWWKGGQNFSVAHPAAAFLGAAFLGPNAAKDFADTLNIADFKAQLNSNGLSNAYATFNGLGTGGDRPTPTQVQNSVKNWVCAAPGFTGLTLLDIGQVPTILLTRCFSKTIQAGLNNGAGHQGYGVISSGAASLPNKGASGMLAEFDAADGGPPPGPRSALTPYATWDARVALGPLLALAVAGNVNRSNSAFQNAVAAANRGMIDLRYKSVNGYRNFEKGKGSVYTENATGNKGGITWCFRTASGPASNGYTLGFWFDVLYPWLTA